MSHEGGCPGRPIVFSAPSGAGKTTIIHRVMERLPKLAFSVSSTTRPKRAGEMDGIDYDFLTREEFEKGIRDGDFIEHEVVHGYLYGTRLSRIEPLLAAGTDVVFDIDVLGALSIRHLYPSAILIYIDVLDREVLRNRLLIRGREDKTEIDRRLERYAFEKGWIGAFDHVVINDDLERAVEETVALIERSRARKPACNGT